MSIAQALCALVGKSTSEKLVARFGVRGAKKLVKKVVILESLSDSEIETLEILGNKDAVKTIQKSEEDIRLGKLCSPSSIL